MVVGQGWSFDRGSTVVLNNHGCQDFSKKFALDTQADRHVYSQDFTCHSVTSECIGLIWQTIYIGDLTNII